MLISRKIILLPMIMLGLASGLFGAVVIHIAGEETYPEDFKSASSVTVEGGEATFTGDLYNNVLVSVTGGRARFFGNIFNGAVFSLSGGVTLIDTLKNNARLHISGNGRLELARAVGNSAEVILQDTALLVLSGADIFGESAKLTATGGTILTQGNKLTFSSSSLSGTTTIDLGGVPDNVDIGELTGEGTIVFTNWSPQTRITFDQARSTIVPETQLLFEGAQTVVSESAATPVPEPAQALLCGILAGLLVLRREGLLRVLHQEKVQAQRG